MKKNLQLYNLLKTIGISKLLKISHAHKEMLKYGRNYMVLHCILALDNIGFINDICKKGRIDIKGYAKENNIDSEYMQAICEYLFIVGIFNKQNLAYSLTKMGKETLEYSRGTFYFIYAYAPLFENLSALLKKEKRYKKDIFRREKYVAEATTEVEQWIPLPVIKRMIERHGFKTVLDLGCGNGRFLINLCADSELNGFGIDIAKESIDYGKKMIAEKALEKRITIAVGDIFDLKNINIDHSKIDVITSMYVLHEFLYDKKDELITLLSNLKKLYKDKYLLICELCKQPSESLRKKPTAIAEHHLFHALSKQGLMTAEEWTALFKKVGYSSVEEKHFDFAGQSYFLLR